MLCGTPCERNIDHISRVNFCVAAARASRRERRRRFSSSAEAGTPANCTVFVRHGVVPSNAVPCVGREACVPHPVFALEHRAAVLAGDALVLREGLALARPLTRVCRSHSGPAVFFPGRHHAGAGRGLRGCDPGAGIDLGMEKSST